MRNILKHILIVFVALQPLHSYTIININNSENDNGFQHLNAELCGSQYSNSISHSQKISNLLDTVNSLILSDMSTDCVCCDSIDIASLDSIHSSANYSVVSSYATVSLISYTTLSNKLLSYSSHPRAPPYV